MWRMKTSIKKCEEIEHDTHNPMMYKRIKELKINGKQAVKVS